MRLTPRERERDITNSLKKNKIKFGYTVQRYGRLFRPISMHRKHTNFVNTGKNCMDTCT